MNHFDFLIPVNKATKITIIKYFIEKEIKVKEFIMNWYLVTYLDIFELIDEITKFLKLDLFSDVKVINKSRKLL